MRSEGFELNLLSIVSYKSNFGKHALPLMLPHLTPSQQKQICYIQAEMQEILQIIIAIRQWIQSQSRPEYERTPGFRTATGESVSDILKHASNTYQTRIASLIHRCAALGAAFAGNNPYSVSTLQAGGAATTGYLSQSVSPFND